MPDQAHIETDYKIKKTKNRLAREYKQAEKELREKLNIYMKQFEAADKEKALLVEEGLMSKKEYIEWRKNKILYSKTLQAKIDSIAERIVNVDKQAADIINKQLAGIYASNYNFASYTIEKGFGINAGFTLVNEETVKKLSKRKPKLLPEKKIDKKKVLRWNRKKVRNAIMQGILQGEPIMDIAKRLETVLGMEWKTAVRNARTAMTAAQNSGRLGSYQNAESIGIKMQKRWLATLDERTRESHQELDGETVPVNEPFSNDLMYPGDPEGDPSEVYNCRCTMVSELEDYPNKNFERYVDGKSVGDMTYKEWVKSKQG